MKTDTEMRALVVEDEPMTRRMLQKIVRGRGHAVDACADGAHHHALLVIDLSDFASVTAEGIETTRPLEAIQELGCEFEQGYLFSRPVPSTEVPRICRSPVLT